MEAKWYVYELIDPRSMDVFYVGKGCGKRMSQHGLKSDNINPYKLNKIKSIGVNNVISRKFALFWDEQAAYKCESDRICDLLDSGCLTNISIATTLAKKKLEPIFSIRECMSYLKNVGWVIAYPPDKYDYTIPTTKEVMPDDFAAGIHKTTEGILNDLRRWSKLGKAIPKGIISRNIRLDLGGLSA